MGASPPGGSGDGPCSASASASACGSCASRRARAAFSPKVPEAGVLTPPPAGTCSTTSGVKVSLTESPPARRRGAPRAGRRPDQRRIPYPAPSSGVIRCRPRLPGPQSHPPSRLLRDTPIEWTWRESNPRAGDSDVRRCLPSIPVRPGSSTPERLHVHVGPTQGHPEEKQPKGDDGKVANHRPRPTTRRKARSKSSSASSA